ncbi:unnamed protein product [Closterium sp. NIES-53]
MTTPPVLAFDADGLPYRFDFWLMCPRLHLWCYIRDGVSLLGHTSGSLPASMTPTEPAADADEDVQRRYRADSLAYRQWSERDDVAQRAVRSLLPVDQRDHFRQVTLAQTLFDAVVSHYSSLSPGTQPLQQRQQSQPKTPSPQQLRGCSSQRRVPGSVETSSLGVCEPGSTFTALVEALHTFTLHSGATRCTTVTPLTAPVPISLADPSGGPVVAAPSGSLTGFHLPSFSKNLVAASGQVDASGQFAVSCSCRLLSHQTLLWYHRLGHLSLPCLRGMHPHLLVSGQPRSLPPLPRSFAPPCLPCVEGRQRAALHSSSFPPTTAPLQTLHMDADVRGVLIDLIIAVRRQLSVRFKQDLQVLRLHSDRGDEISSDHLRDFGHVEGIRQTFTLPASPQ